MMEKTIAGLKVRYDSNASCSRCALIGVRYCLFRSGCITRLGGAWVLIDEPKTQEDPNDGKGN